MFNYPARVTRDGDGYLVTFPDIPEAVTGAKDRAEAIELAADALTTAMDFYFEDRRPVHARPQEVTRLVDLHHPTKIDTIAAAFLAMGKRLDLRVS